MSQEVNEEDILDRIETGLNRACDQRGLTLTPGDAIKRQKYVDIAIEEFLENVDNPPVTHSWFKYGVHTPAGGGGASAFEQVETPESPSIDSDPVEEFVEMSAEDFADFYLSGDYYPPLDSCQMETLPFLREFYIEYAPDWVKELYLANVKLRKHLLELQSQVDPDEDGYWPTNSELQQRYEEVSRLTAGMELKLGRNDLFETVEKPVSEFLVLINMTFLGVTELSDSDQSYELYQYVTELKEFYDERAWELVAFVISRKTAKGPNADQLESWADEALSEFDPETRDKEPAFYEEISELKDFCITAGGYPKPSSFPSRTSDMDETLGELLHLVDGRETENTPDENTGDI